MKKLSLMFVPIGTALIAVPKFLPITADATHSNSIPLFMTGSLLAGLPYLFGVLIRKKTTHIKKTPYLLLMIANGFVFLLAMILKINDSDSTHNTQWVNSLSEFLGWYYVLAGIAWFIFLLQQNMKPAQKTTTIGYTFDEKDIYHAD